MLLDHRDEALSSILAEPRARDAFVARLLLDSPWALRIHDQMPLTLIASFPGQAWVVPDDHDPFELTPGSVVVMRGSDNYTLADDPGTQSQLVIHPGPRCVDLRGNDLTDMMRLGARTWGTSLTATTELLVAGYHMPGDVGRRLLRAIPDRLLVTDGAESPVVAMLLEEMAKDRPGQRVILDRLIDLLLADVIRLWLSNPGTEPPELIRAYSDPIVGPALRALRERPAHTWTVAELAHHVGASRATLARRFTELVGEPPMTFLANWRIDLAADLLTDGETTIGAVAHKVGYGSPYALSTAFKRNRGVSPSEHRSLVHNRRGHRRRTSLDE